MHAIKLFQNLIQSSSVFDQLCSRTLGSWGRKLYLIKNSFQPVTWTDFSVVWQILPTKKYGRCLGNSYLSLSSRFFIGAGIRHFLLPIYAWTSITFHPNQCNWNWEY